MIEIIVNNPADLTPEQHQALKGARTMTAYDGPLRVVARKKNTQWATIGIQAPGAWYCPRFDAELIAAFIDDVHRTMAAPDSTRSDWAYREDLLWIDLETRSSVDLKKAPVYRYVESPDHEIQICAWAKGGGPVQVAVGEGQIRQVPGLLDNRVLKVAHNANFERISLSRLAGLPVGEYLDPRSFIDTAELAAAYGYPRDLKGWTNAMGGEVKDEAGTKLINLFAKPPFADPADHPEKWAQYVEYCRQDVASMRDAARLLGRRYPTDEQRVSVVDKQVNDRGVAIDLALASRGAEQAEANKSRDLARIRQITGVDNPGSRVQIGRWLLSRRVYVNLGGHGVPEYGGFLVPEEERDRRGWVADPFDKEAVKELLEWTDLPGDVREVLTLMQDTSKAATTKFAAAVRGVSRDDRYRGSLRFFGASTGRWAGSGIQLQNASHDHWGNEDDGDEALEEASLDGANRLLAGEPMGMDDLGKTIRAMLLGPFLVGDYAAIEARVLAWLAGEEWRVEFFRKGEGDIYCESASRIFKVPVVKHGVNGHLRQKGKVSELACGYGGGQMAVYKMGGKDIPATERQEVVDLWRSSNPRIVTWWALMQRAVQRGGRAGRITVTCDGDDRWVWLPSGRPLVYRNVRAEEYWVTDKRTKETTRKFGLRCDSPRPGGGRLALSPMVTAENPTQAVARDLLAHALLALSERGARIVSHVHDEIIIEDDGTLPLEEFARVMSEVPEWARTLPVAAEGYRCYRYRKG